MPPKKASAPAQKGNGQMSEQEKAALKIQSIQRGNNARKDLAKQQGAGAAKGKGSGAGKGGGLKALDKNGDGTLSKAEVKAAVAQGLISQEAVNRLDRDHDGAISKKEMEAGMAQQKAKQAPKGGATGIKALDKDGDGTLSKAEVRDAIAKGLISEEAVRRLDANHDGSISKAEFQAGMAQQQGKGAAKGGAVGIKALDRDGDGTLSKAEVRDAIAKGLISEEAVRRLDVNHDGSISKKELEAGMAQQKGKGAAKGAAPVASRKVAAPVQVHQASRPAATTHHAQASVSPRAYAQNAASAAANAAGGLARAASPGPSHVDAASKQKDLQRKYAHGFETLRWVNNEPVKEATAWILKQVLALEKTEAYMVRKSDLYQISEAFAVAPVDEREDLVSSMARGYLLQPEKDRKTIQTIFREFLLAWVNKHQPDPHAKKPTHQIENLITIVTEAAAPRTPLAEREAVALKAQSEAIRIMEHDPDELLDIFSGLDQKHRARFVDALIKAKLVPEAKRKELKEMVEPGGVVDQVAGPIGALHFCYMNKWVVVVLSIVEFVLARWLTPCGDLMFWLKGDSVISFLAAVALYGMCMSLAPIYLQLREDPSGTMDKLADKDAAAKLGVDKSLVTAGTYFGYATAVLFMIGALWATWSTWSLVRASICLFSCQCRLLGLITCWFFVVLRLMMFWGFIHFVNVIKTQVTKHSSSGDASHGHASYGSTGGSEP